MDSRLEHGSGPRVIFNADDFGRTPEINAAVIRAHRDGVLTSASLMVGAAAAGEAVALARANPALGVGLHVVVSSGRAVLPAARIPHLLDAGGGLPGATFRTGLRYALHQPARRELAREVAAQFERFADTGLPLTHVDCHEHMHIHPAVLGLLLPLAEHFGACGIRLPRDDFQLAREYNRRIRNAGNEQPPVEISGSESSVHRPSPIVHRPWSIVHPSRQSRADGPGATTLVGWAIIFGLLCRLAAQRLRRHRLAFTERVYGLARTGRMEEGYVVEVLRRLRVPSAEIYFHPSTVTQGEEFGPNPVDLATLLSPAVRRVIMEHHLRPSTYATLERTTNNTNKH